MRIVVFGATGNVGTSILRSLAEEPEVRSILGVARRRPELDAPKTQWAQADISRDDLGPLVRGADVVVHLAWLIQPSRDLDVVRSTNVTGSGRVFDAVARAGVPALVYASSVGAYSPAPKDRFVDEAWPAEGIPTSFYSRHKAEVERMLDAFETAHPSIRVVRLRPALIFKYEAASGIRRLFAGPLLPTFLLRRSWISVVPNIRNLRFQAVHSYDVGDAYRRAIVGDVRGAFNIASDPVLDPDELSDLLDARKLPIAPGLARSFTRLTWMLRLQPTPQGWLDMGLNAPLLDSRRARAELGWEPRYSSREALMDLVRGLRAGAGLPTPPLDPRTTAPLRWREFATGIGGR